MPLRRRFVSKCRALPVFGAMLPRRVRLPLESSLGTAPQYPISCRAPGKRETWPNSAAIVTAEMCAVPRNACRSVITSCNAGEASFTASTMACSSRTTRSRMCSTSCR